MFVKRKISKSLIISAKDRLSLINSIHLTIYLVLRVCINGATKN